MIRASTPFREVLVEMVVFGLNFVPKRFEELVNEIGSAAARESGYQRVELSGWSASSCRSLLRPFIAVPNT